jgi:hypothetical protein
VVGWGILNRIVQLKTVFAECSRLWLHGGVSEERTACWGDEAVLDVEALCQQAWERLLALRVWRCPVDSGVSGEQGPGRGEFLAQCEQKKEQRWTKSRR